MTRYLLAGVAGFGLLSTVAFAQTYPPAPPPIRTPAPMAVPGSTSATTTTVVPSASGDRASTVTKSVDENGNTVTKKDTLQRGRCGQH
jgi:hypothetical protein